MVELRKRPAPPSAPPPAKKKATSKANGKKDAAPVAKPEPKVPAAPVAKPEPEVPADQGADKVTKKAPKKGDKINLEGFGGEVTTHDDEKVTLAKLVVDSKAGVVLFTYPKANTPGCTTQACLFRDSYEPLTATGLSIYGLSTDSPKSNTSFKTKHSFPYALLCDPKAILIQAIGLKKAPSGTTRGVFVVAKDGTVLAAEPGGPAPTVEIVKKLVETMGGSSASKGIEKAEETANNDAKMADTAAQVADSAEKIDGGS